MQRHWYLLLIFFCCKTRGSRLVPAHGKGEGTYLFGNTSHLPDSQKVRFIRAARSQDRSSTNRVLYASITAGFSDTTFNGYIQGLLSEVIKQLLPLDITKSLPKTANDVSELLKGREDPNISGSLKSKVDKSDMLKVIQSMRQAPVSFRTGIGNLWPSRYYWATTAISLVIAKILILPTLMKFSPSDKVQLSLPVEIGLEGESTKSGIFSSSVKVKINVISKLLWDPSKDQIFIIEASRIFINDIQVKQQKRRVVKIFHNTVTVEDLELRRISPGEDNMQAILWTILIDVINHCIRLVADLLNVSILSMLASAGPAGTFGTIQYNLIGSPKVTDRYFLVPYQAIFQVPLPGSLLSTTPFQVSPHPGTNVHLALSKDFISYGITAMTGGSRVKLTQGAGQKQLMTTELTSAVPKMSEHFPVAQPMVVEIRGSNIPLVSMDSQSATVKQTLFTEVLVHGQSALHLEVNIIFKAELSAPDGKLLISLSQSSFVVVQASSSVGSTNAQKVHEYISGIHSNSFLPAMNGMLSRGIPLPSILNVKWTNVNTALSQDGLVISM